jgi:leucyl-tRNA synthetase
MGWDAFGLPAENYAISRDIHPRTTTRRHADTYRRQMKLVECSYDWSREFSSTDPEFYRWTQWFFLLLYKHNLAYQAVGSQWWCPKDKTILANEQVIKGRCWRCGTMVTKKDLKQWYFKITDYADRLIYDLETVDWPESIKLMQRNWIGRSKGVEVDFPVNGDSSNGTQISAFTTRPDTLFGVTFLVLAPEHPLANSLTRSNQHAEVDAYVQRALGMTELDRLATDKEKTGVFTGSYAIHPVTKERLPVWVADYVMMDYGSGAVMGVPGHDSRDFEFARKFNLPIVEVVSPDGVEHGARQAFTEPGIMIHSDKYTGLSSREGGLQLADDLAARGLGRNTVSYKMRDWLISRQRYWGAPIPIIHCQSCGTVPVPEEELPVLLPEIEDFEPTGDGRSPLAKVHSWVNTSCPECGGAAHRETDTMDGFACSSWYFLRFTSPDFEEGPFDPAAGNYWMPVDTYVGGAEHAVMHLLYARFWTKVMHDAGLVPYIEPFSQLRNQGVLHAADGRRMSKSRGNVVTPDEVVAEHGTDALRTYILFIGPFDGDVVWNDKNIVGVDRFLERYWRLALELHGLKADCAVSTPDESEDAAFRREMHRIVKRVTQDFERFKFNTAVASLMQYLNYLYDQKNAPISNSLWGEAFETYTRLLCPIAPFVTEEVWQEVLDHKGSSVHQTSWPGYDEALIAAEEVTIMVQINGKLRDQVVVPSGIGEESLQEIVLAQAKVQKYLNGRSPSKMIVVPEKLINIVLK